MEWYGQLSPARNLLYSDKLRHMLQSKGIIYLYGSIRHIDVTWLGNDVTSQLYSADCIITETDTHHTLLRTYNREAKIVTAPTPEKVEQLCRNSTWGLIPNLLVIGITAIYF